METDSSPDLTTSSLSGQVLLDSVYLLQEASPALHLGGLRACTVPTPIPPYLLSQHLPHCGHCRPLGIRTGWASLGRGTFKASSQGSHHLPRTEHSTPRRGDGLISLGQTHPKGIFFPMENFLHICPKLESLMWLNNIPLETDDGLVYLPQHFLQASLHRGARESPGARCEEQLPARPLPAGLWVPV